jgi:two-component system response regulator (stage 0 sporulation protein F)
MAMKLDTRVFELCNGKYRNLNELARAMGLSLSQVYRVRKGQRRINEKFIIGTLKAFPNHRLDDLFYPAPESLPISPMKGQPKEKYTLVDAIEHELVRGVHQKTKGKPVRVLVVDDEQDIGELIAEILKNCGCQVTPVVNGTEALQLMNNQHFDLVFLDLVMPDLDGSELFKRIRERDNDIPVAIITGHPDSDLMKKAKELNPFLTIP